MKIEEYETIRKEVLIRFRWTFEIVFFSIVSTSAIISWLATQPGETLASLSPYVFISTGSGIVAYLFWFYRQTLKHIHRQGSYLAVFHELEKEELRFHIVSRFGEEIRQQKSTWGVDGRNVAHLLAILVFANLIGPVYFMKSEIGFLIVTFLVVFVSCFVLTLFGRLFKTTKDVYRAVLVAIIVGVIFFLFVLQVVPPFCFLQEKIWPPSTYFEATMIIIILPLLYIFIIYEIWLPLRKTKEFMHEDMKQWLKLKEKLMDEEILTDNKKLEERIRKILEQK